MTTCPFCGCDPHEYVDVGVGWAPVAITCCDPGVAFFTDRDKDEVVLSGADVTGVGNTLIALRARLEKVETENAALTEAAAPLASIAAEYDDLVSDAPDDTRMAVPLGDLRRVRDIIDIIKEAAGHD